MCGFRKFNVATKKDPYMLPFIDKVITIVVGHDGYTFLDGFSKYHQIFHNIRGPLQNLFCY
jgi:hypothetical protein